MDWSTRKYKWCPKCKAKPELAPGGLSDEISAINEDMMKIVWETPDEDLHLFGFETKNYLMCMCDPMKDVALFYPEEHVDFVGKMNKEPYDGGSQIIDDAIIKKHGYGDYRTEAYLEKLKKYK